MTVTRPAARSMDMMKAKVVVAWVEKSSCPGRMPCNISAPRMTAAGGDPGIPRVSKGTN